MPVGPSSGALQLHFDPKGALHAATRACEAAIFLHWYGNTSEQWSAEYGGYESASVFVSLTDGDDVVGACRLIMPGPAGLKSVVDAGREPWSVDGERSAAAAGIDLSTTWDIATFGIRPGLHGPSTARVASLWHGLFLACQANGVTAIVAVLDSRLRRLMSTMGLIVHTLPGTQTAPYLGSSASTPVYAGLANLLNTQRRLAPDAHRLVTLGVGLDVLALPDRSTFRLQRTGRVIDLTQMEGSERSGTLKLDRNVAVQQD